MTNINPSLRSFADTRTQSTEPQRLDRWPRPSERELRNALEAVRDVPGVMAARIADRDGWPMMKVFARNDSSDLRDRVERRAYNNAPGLRDVRIDTLPDLLRDIRDIRGVRDARWNGDQIVVDVRDSHTARYVRDMIEDRTWGQVDYRFRGAGGNGRPDWVDVVVDIFDAARR